MQKKDILKVGAKITIDLVDSAKYFEGLLCEVDSEEPNKSLKIKLYKPDAYILRISPLATIFARCTSPEGVVFSFKAKIKEKKIPFIVLQYPSEIYKVSDIGAQLVPISFWTNISTIVPTSSDKLQKKNIGDGTIVEMGPGVCKLMCEHKFQRHELLWLAIKANDDGNEVLIKGVIKDIKDAPYGCYYYIIEFMENSPDFFDNIKKMLSLS